MLGATLLGDHFQFDTELHGFRVKDGEEKRQADGQHGAAPK